jgi:hypothetical protein
VYGVGPRKVDELMKALGLDPARAGR